MQIFYLQFRSRHRVASVCMKGSSSYYTSRRRRFQLILYFRNKQRKKSEYSGSRGLGYTSYALYFSVMCALPTGAFA
ncbi:MAG: hypothetical protein BLITH_0772 [Brockia lithotrophica]|uniref:Uncharacterized protein n=1 Tax=Brockia lithotrophica TaxID=933949 RepID=A0A2T5G8S1_9BACL|nr:MAG: hypothetical protein BLITH_0772 [Brockia lithotrophica]